MKMNKGKIVGFSKKDNGTKIVLYFYNTKISVNHHE